MPNFSPLRTICSITTSHQMAKNSIILAQQKKVIWTFFSIWRMGGCSPETGVVGMGKMYIPGNRVSCCVGLYINGISRFMFLFLLSVFRLLDRDCVPSSFLQSEFQGKYRSVLNPHRISRLIPFGIGIGSCGSLNRIIMKLLDWVGQWGRCWLSGVGRG